MDAFTPTRLEPNDPHHTTFGRFKKSLSVIQCDARSYHICLQQLGGKVERGYISKSLARCSAIYKRSSNHTNPKTAELMLIKQQAKLRTQVGKLVVPRLLLW
jgi:hypothetical protein